VEQHVVYSRAGENQISQLSIHNRAERPRHRLAKLGPTTSSLSATPIITIGSALDKEDGTWPLAKNGGRLQLMYVDKAENALSMLRYVYVSSAGKTPYRAVTLPSLITKWPLLLSHPPL
jgi:hypothetical protein